jgi:hypothetical protein
MAQIDQQIAALKLHVVIPDPKDIGRHPQTEADHLRD